MTDFAGILLAWFCAGTLIAGNTGAGKSTLIEFLLLQIARQTQGVWVTDMYKRRIRHMRPLLQRFGRDLIVLSSARCTINVLQATGEPRRFCTFISDLIVRVLGLPPRAGTILRSTIHALYARFGIYEGRTDRWPTLFDLFVTVKGAKDLNAQAREALLDRLGSLLGGLGSTAAYRRAWSPLDLAEHCIVFEMLGAGEQAKTLILAYCMFSLFLHDMTQAAPLFRGLRHWICIEDAQRFFRNGADSSASDMPPFEELAGVMRESGRGLCIAVQSMYGLSAGMTANLATKIMGRLGSHQDWDHLGHDMGMSAEQIAYAKLSLRPGRFVMQVSSGDWRHPFLATVPEMRIPPTVTDAEADASIQALAHLPLERAPEFDRWEPFETIEIADSMSASATSNGSLDQGEVEYLQAVMQNPGRRSSDYPDLAGMGPRRALQIRRRLVDRGFLREHEVAKAATGRAAIVLEPMPCAYEALGLPLPSEKGGA